MQPRDLGIGRLFYSIRDAVVVADVTTGRIVLWNPAAETIFGYSTAEALDLPLEWLVPEPLRPQHRTGMPLHLLTGHAPVIDSPVPLELPALRKDGTEITVELTLSRIDDDVDRDYVLAIIRDITGRRKIEESLRGTEEKYRGIIENAVEGIYQTSPSGRLIMANPALARICGYPSPEEMIAALTDIENQVYVDPNRRAEFMHQLEEHDAVYQFESEIYRKDGSTIWISENARSVRDANGALLYYEGTVQDISDRKRAERERAQSIREQAARRAAEAAQQRYAFLAEASAVLASSLDYETTLANLAYLAVPRLTDWCLVDVIADDQSIRRVAAVHRDPTKRPILQELLEQYPLDPEAEHPIATALRTGKVQFVPEVPEEALTAVAVDTNHLRLLRELHTRSFMVVPLLARGRILGALSFAQTEPGPDDLPADLAVAEDLARRAALAVDNARLYREAQRAIEERDDFISVAAHELKTPMTSLRATAQLIVRRLEKQGTLEPTAIQRAFRTIDQQTEKLSRLVSQLLETVRIQSGKLALERQVVDLVPIVQGVAARAQLSTDRHALVVHAPSSVRASVDPLRLEQVLTNLLDNAIKFSPQGGRIDLDVSTPTPEMVRLAVQDHGMGIPPEHRDQIFNRFHQAHGESHTSGMGLGLYISRQIVELHGGQIEAEFPPEGGTRFVVTLPIGLDHVPVRQDNLT